MVFYRKYRPQKIEDLDSKEVREKLYNVLGSATTFHAFLFTGSKGLGKTSAARIVAKVVNCEEKSILRQAQDKSLRSKLQLKTQKLRHEETKEQIEPCNKCYQCVSITNGTNIDVLEIDGASNRGIDEIRDLREKVRLSPAISSKKVYIIDEVHMLTQEAFNALLKTVEEPPSHVVFILCTTEPHKVPSTIASRCLHIQFKKAGGEELVRSFERIIKEEKLKADKEALGLIASLSDGSFRDGVKILEEIALLGRKKITKDLVEKEYQILSIQYQTAQMMRFLENKDTKNALGSVAKIVNDGVEIGHFMRELIDTLHNSLLFKAGIQKNSDFRIESSELSMGEIKRLIELLSKAHSELKYAVLPQLPLELAIVEWTLQKTQSVRDSEDQKVRNSDMSDNPTRRNSDSLSTPSFPRITQQNIAKYNEHDALWTALIDKVKSYNHSIAGVLRGCNIKSYDDKNLIIEAKFKFHKDKLSEPRTHEILEKTCQEITKKNISVEVLLKVPA